MRRPGSSALVSLVLVAVVAAVYSPAARFGFVDFDDPDVVTGNPHVRTGLTAANVRWALTGFAVGHWEPLTWWSLQADASVWHLRPGPMHVENVALHAAGSLVLYGMLATATGAAGRSAVVAGLFAVHPMHVESVAWITERRDVLSTPLLLAAVWAYVRSARGGRWTTYAAFLVLYALGLCAKATGITLPAVLVLLHVWPLRWTGWRRITAAVVPPLAMAIIAAGLAVAAQRAAGAASTLSELTLADRLSNAVVTTVVYVVKLAVPTGLAVMYPHPGSRPAGAVVAAGGLLLLVTGGAWRQRHRRPYLLVGWGWFLITLLPTSGIVQSGVQAMADRYSYVPSIGLAVAVVWAVADAVPTAAGAALAAVVVAVAAGVARRQVGFWRDTETLFTRAAAVTDGNAVADVALGRVAAARHDPAAAEARYDRAVAEQPGYARGFVALGDLYLDRHDPATAAGLFATAVRLRPAVADFRVRHAAALSALPGRRGQAIAECRAALSLDPADADARAGLADLLARPPEAAP